MDALDDQAMDALGRAADELFGPPGRSHHRAAVLAAAAATAAHERPISLTTWGPRRTALIVIGPPRSQAAHDDPFAMLSARERDVAGLLAEGLSNGQVAARLFVSVSTVKDHVHHILTKTGFANRAAVAGRWRALYRY